MDTPSAGQRQDEPLRVQVQTAVEILRSGGVVSVPTDTLYGLAASAMDPEAVLRLFRIKGRQSDRALPLLLADPGDIATYAVDVPAAAAQLAERFFPGPLTLVLRSAHKVPDAVSAGLETIALRVPDHPVPRQVARELGTAITGTSANRSGMPAQTTAEGVREQLGADIDYVVDGGSCPGGVVSTVLDLSGPSPVILRLGALSRREIEDACAMPVAVNGEPQPVERA